MVYKVLRASDNKFFALKKMNIPGGASASKQSNHFLTAYHTEMQVLVRYPLINILSYFRIRCVHIRIS